MQKFARISAKKEDVQVDAVSEWMKLTGALLISKLNKVQCSVVFPILKCFPKKAQNSIQEK